MMNNKNNKLEYYLNRLRDKVQLENEFSSLAATIAQEIDAEIINDLLALSNTTFEKNPNIHFDASGKQIFVEEDITFQDLYAYAKDLWKHDDELILYQFPFTAIHPGQFIIENGWNFVYGAIKHIKDAGWEVRNERGEFIDQYTCIKTLGPEHKEQLNYSVDGDYLRIFSRRGQVNEAVRTMDGKSIAILSKNTGFCSTDCGITELQPNVIYIPMCIQTDPHGN